MHQQVCISVWHDAPEGGGAPRGPGALQGRLPREAEELPQHRQPLTRPHQERGRGLTVIATPSAVISVISRFSVSLASRLVSRTLTRWFSDAIVTRGRISVMRSATTLFLELKSGSCSDISVYSVYISMLQLCCMKIIIHAASTISKCLTQHVWLLCTNVRW